MANFLSKLSMRVKNKERSPRGQRDALRKCPVKQRNVRTSRVPLYDPVNTFSFHKILGSTT